MRLPFIWAMFLLAGPVLALPVLRVAISDNKPPYTMVSPPSGIEYDLVKTIVEGMGMTPEIQFLPNARAQALLKSGQLDAAIGNSGPGLSQPFIAYENTVIALRSRFFTLKTISDLRSLSLGAFQNAHLYLGTEFAEMAAANAQYREASPQVLLNRLLYSGRIDAVVSDWNIFQALNSQVGDGLDTRQEVVAYRLFRPTRYGLNFTNTDYLEAFNASLARVLAADPYPALAKKYSLGVTTFRP